MKHFFITFFILILSSQIIMASQSLAPIVSIEWLKKHFDDKNLLIVDVREKKEYLKEHIEGAINIPANENLFVGDKLLMPKLSALQKLFSEAGINDDSVVVSYDGGLFYFSARLYWLLKVLGHEKASLLSVSYGNWEKDDILVDNKVVHKEKTTFIPHINNNLIATKLDVLVSIGKATIIDGRRNSDYIGKTSSTQRYGHIPTAINFPSTLAYTSSILGNKLKDWKKLKEVFGNIDKDKKVILYCDDSAEAALDGLILNQLGYSTIVYEGSWLEWGSDISLPINNPSKKR
ncbi:MAG: sulfurtransferase [Epsilonproteobacteria bacterium]|nr:sulfurtransferase [Campylobacterota bacterium]